MPRLFPWAAALACTPWLTAVALSPHSAMAVIRSPGLFAIVATDALVFEAILITIAAPVGGVWIASTSGGSVGATVRGLVLSLSAFVGASCLLGLGASLAGALDILILLQSRIALAMTMLALASFGALCAAVFVDVLDAAAAALLTVLVAAAGLIVSGPASADFTERAINAGLLASPIIAATSAARIDLLRSAAIYELSPIAHRRFEYPDWESVSAWYLLVAGCCLLLMVWKLRRPRSPFTG